MPARDPSFVLQLHAGDIGAVLGLKLARTGDTLCSNPRHAALRGLHVPPCVFGLRLEPYSNADMPALEVGLQRLLREDPSLQLVLDNESNSVTLRGMGELHLEVALHRLCKDFGCKVLLFLAIAADADFYKVSAFLLQVSSSSLHVAYREGLRAGSVAHASAEINRSMGAKRLVASVDVELSALEGIDAQMMESDKSPIKHHLPLRKSASMALSETIVALPNGCSLQVPPGIAHVFAENLIGGVATSLSIGPLMACALHNIRVTIKSFQVPDANATMAPVSLRVAVSQAVSNALHMARHLQDGKNSDLVLLEPVMRVVVTAPQSVIGAVVSDIGNRRRGAILEVASCDNCSSFDDVTVESQVVADVPIAELIGYASSLRSMTGGSASFSATFLKYNIVADENAQRILGT